VQGKLERRDGVVNVVAASLEALAAPDIALAEVRPIEPPAGPETGRTPASEDADAALPRVAAAAGAGRRAGRPATDIAAVAPRPHSFGRRGR
jgi:hypothetical protein